MIGYYSHRWIQCSPIFQEHYSLYISIVYCCMIFNSIIFLKQFLNYIILIWQAPEKKGWKSSTNQLTSFQVPDAWIGLWISTGINNSNEVPASVVKGKNLLENRKRFFVYLPFHAGFPIKYLLPWTLEPHQKRN